MNEKSILPVVSSKGKTGLIVALTMSLSISVVGCVATTSTQSETQTKLSKSTTEHPTTAAHTSEQLININEFPNKNAPYEMPMDKSTPEQIDYLIIIIGDHYSELGPELKKLPEFGNSKQKHVESLDDFATYLLTAQNPFRIETSLKKVLSEGIPEGRVYCSPLEAVLLVI